jgi:DNA modification methylase
MVEMWDDIFSTYNRGIKTSVKKGEGDKAFDKMHKLLDDCWAECYRLLAPGGFMAINIGNATRSLDGHFEMYSNHSRIMQSCKKIGFDILPYIIWNKPTNSPTKFMGSGVLPAGAYITLEHEYILVFRKAGKRIFTEKEKQIRRQSAFFWEERNQWFSDQWHDIRGKKQQLKSSANRDRSGAYPVEIAKRLLLMYSMYGDTVLDPFSGTGTTSYAAMCYGRNSVYVDIDQELRQSSLTDLSATEQVDLMNQDIRARIKTHEDYVAQQQTLFFKYRNDIINSPVKSNQEKLLQPYLIKDLKSTKDKIKVSYSPFKGA